MELLALNGQRGAALTHYETCRRLLASELGVEPSEPTQRLVDLLRRGEWPPPTLVAAGLPPVTTRAVGPCPYRGLAAERHGRRLLAALAGVLALAAIVASTTVFFLRQRQEALQAYSRSLAIGAQKALDDGDTAAALALALEATSINNPPLEARQVLMAAAYAPGAAWRAEAAALFPGLGGPITALAISPDGGLSLAGLADGTIVLWEIAAREVRLRLPGHAGRVNALAFDRDGSTALSGGADGQVILWDLATGQLVRRSGGHGVMMDLAVSPDGDSILAGSSDTTIFRWRLGNPSLAALRGWVEANRYVVVR